MPDSKKILVTGTAGFIGFHLAERLINEGYDVYGLDVINDYYDINLKFARLAEHGIRLDTIPHSSESLDDRGTIQAAGQNSLAGILAELGYGLLVQSTKYSNYKFIRLDLADHDNVVNFMVEQKFDYVVNLAAQAGVRYSIDNPRAYTHSNIDGFLSILEGARYSKVKHLIYASTSSVYGLNTEMPLSEDQKTDRPMALYAATKKANELFAHSYSHLFDLPTTGLRFFTVYGPWGRPDMALFLFAEAMLKDEPINVFNHGKMIRDFTYVDDIVESITRLIQKPLTPRYNLTPSSSNHSGTTSNVSAQVFNIGNSAPVELMAYIEALEKALGKTAKKNLMDIQAGDVPATHADVSKLEEYVNFRPKTSVEEGVKRFVDWYLKSKSTQQ
jgi:UDP-glucuronate 4-epimerase